MRIDITDDDRANLAAILKPDVNACFKLTQREGQMVRLWLRHGSASAVARKLGISPSRVSWVIRKGLRRTRGMGCRVVTVGACRYCGK